MGGENIHRRTVALEPLHRLHDDAPVHMDHQPQPVFGSVAGGGLPGAFQKVQRLPHLLIKGPATVVEHHPVGPAVKQGGRQFFFQPFDALGDVGGGHVVFFGGLGEIFGEGGVTKIGQLQQFHKSTPLPSL